MNQGSSRGEKDDLGLVYYGSAFLCAWVFEITIFLYNVSYERVPTQRAWLMAAKKLDFKSGQFVVYPTQGVGKVVRVEEQSIGGQKNLAVGD